MKYSIYVFSNDVIKGQTKFDITNLHRFFASVDSQCEKLVFFDFNKTSNWQTLQSNFPNDENQIVLLENAQIDDFTFDHVQSLGKYLGTIDEQALLFEKDGKKIIFLPVDNDYLTLLKKIIKAPEGKKIYQLKLFGLTKTRVENDLEEIKNSFMGVNYNLFYDNLIYEIYLSYFGEQNLIDDVQLKTASKFKDAMFSESDLSLEGTIFQLLRLKNYKIAIHDGATGGYVENKLLSQPNFDEVIKSTKIDRQLCTPTSEALYNYSLSALSQTSADLVLVFTKASKGEGEEYLFALADKKSVHVFKNKFAKSQPTNKILATNSALFHLFKKLKQNDFDFR